ncbi:Ribosomal L32p protein family [Carex littledalei]|uniref:Large ribosomal subunit protein bL32m n=1 Tax=Carex littledalei TaxID=544730 RepID=A0A833VEL9_9POAL|nr:Ribosomal L32p protein family [Carex littledalei]
MAAAGGLIRRVSSQLSTIPRPLLPFSSSMDLSLVSLTPSEVPSVPRLPFEASLELMAVPKKKVSKYKRGLRNGPKALKPIPVIVRCLACGRVKLPHFYCCSGKKESDSSS